MSLLCHVFADTHAVERKPSMLLQVQPRNPLALEPKKEEANGNMNPSSRPIESPISGGSQIKLGGPDPRTRLVAEVG